MNNMRKLINLMEDIESVPRIGSANESLKGALVGGALGAAVTKSPSGAIAGANIGSEIEDTLGLEEKSKSEKQARFMAAAAHDPAFAKRVGINQDVAKEFNKADTGTDLLSKASKHKKESINAQHSHMTVDDVVAAYKSGEISYNEFMDYLSSGPESDDNDEYVEWSMHQGELGRHAPAISEGFGISVHTFPDSRSAYDATQTGQWYDDATDSEVEVKNGDILVIPDEGVVGLCSTWPVAVTANAGQLHAMKSEYATPEDIAEVTKLPLAAVQVAFQKAQELGFETVGNIQENLNNGYRDVDITDGQDFFPNGADGSVVKKVGPSGAKQGDNPEQKKMQIIDEHKELVYAYRKFLSESDNTDKLKKKLKENTQTLSNFKIIDLDLSVDSKKDWYKVYGPISALATVFGLDGKPKEIGWDVQVNAIGDVEWQTEETPIGWNYKTDSPTYSTYAHAVPVDMKFEEISFKEGSTIHIDGEDLPIEQAQSVIDIRILKSLLDPKLYENQIAEYVDSKVAEMESSDFEPDDDYYDNDIDIR